MSCLPCFQNDDEDDEGNDNQPTPAKTETQMAEAAKEAASSSNAKTFTFRELAMATKNFRQECLLGEGGFGRVFKGTLQSTGQVVAVKQLDRNNMQGNNEFLVEILMLSLLQHPNLVSLIGYCADGDQRLLVYEYLQMGNLEHHLFDEDPEKKTMDWYTRMKIAVGAAQGLEYLHEKANPPIIYRDLKPSNILLDDDYEPKLSDCGLAKLGGGGGKINPTSRVMGTYGYSAPEYSSSGELTLKSDMYSFGVVLLELITGRRGIDTTRPNDEQNLVTWAQPIFREPKRFPDLADPRLNKEFPVTGINQAVGICAMCLQEEPAVRPLVSDVVAALSFLSVPQASTTHYAATHAAKENSPKAFSPPPEQKMEYGNEGDNQSPHSDKNKSDHDDDGNSDESESENENEKENEGSNRGRVSEKQNEVGQPSVGEESGRKSETQNSDDSEDEGTYTGSSSEDGDSSKYNDAETTELGNSGGSSKYADAETTELGNSGRSNESVFSLNSGQSESSRKSSEFADAGNLSSEHGSSRRSSSPTKRSGSRRRKLVVTFKEPSKSSIRGGNNKDDNQEETSSENPPVATTEERQQSSSSSSESSSSSDSENEQESTKRKTAKHRENAGSMDGNENTKFDDLQNDKPQLRHMQTR